MIITNALGNMLRSLPDKWKIILLDSNKEHVKTLDTFVSAHGGADNYKTLTFNFTPNSTYVTDYIEVYYDDILLHEIVKNQTHTVEEVSKVEVKVYI